jgi:hypothetical protein
MIAKPLNELKIADLRALLGNAREGKLMEFKREMPARTPDEKIKFLAAVSSLANTAGGDLMVGIEAVHGLAHAIPGIEILNVDAEKLRLEQLLATLIEPRLPRVDMEAVGTDDNRHVMLVRVPRSWIGPHRVVPNNRFYGRNSGGKYPLDVSELRTAFVLSETAVERIRAFRSERLIKIAAGDTPVPMHPGARMAIHVVPLSTFAAARTLDIVQEMGRGHVMPLPPGRIGHPNEYRPNLDGLVTFTDPGAGQPTGGYAQVFRSGAVEGVDVLHIDGHTEEPYLLGAIFEGTAVSAIRNYVAFVKSLGLGYPIVIFVSFCGMRGCHLRTPTEFGVGHYTAGPLTQDVIPLPEVSLESETLDAADMLRPIFNQVWNAFGFMGSNKYDQSGKWIGRV